MPKKRLCRWNCGRLTDRRCGICLFCIDARDARDARDKAIDAGELPYIPPTERPGHRFYKGGIKRERSDKQKAALEKARATRKQAVLLKETAQGETL